MPWCDPSRPIPDAFKPPNGAPSYENTPVLMPTIEIGPPESLDAVDRVLDRLEEFDWIVFISTNGVSG